MGMLSREILVFLHMRMQVGHSQWPQLCLQANKYIKKQAYEDHYPQVWFSYQNHSTSPSIGDVLLTCLITRGTWMVFLTAVSIYMQKLEPSRLEAVCWRLKKKCACQCCWKLGIWCWKFHIWWLFQNAMQLGKNLLAAPLSVHLSLSKWHEIWKNREEMGGAYPCVEKSFLVSAWDSELCPMSHVFLPKLWMPSAFRQVSWSSRAAPRATSSMRRVDYWSPIASRCGIHHKPSPSPHEQFMIMNGLYVDHPQMLGINKMKLYHKKKLIFSTWGHIFTGSDLTGASTSGSLFIFLGIWILDVHWFTMVCGKMWVYPNTEPSPMEVYYG